MLLKIPSVFLSLIGSSFLIWILLTTVLPQIVLKYGQYDQWEVNSHLSITSPSPVAIKNSTVYFLIGHPDDEVMFFSPSIIELSKERHKNKVRLLCLSSGDAESEVMGAIRRDELYKSARILGIEEKDVMIVGGFKDGMDIIWDKDDIKKILQNNINDLRKKQVLVTFDEKGVSKHFNHISLYHGAKTFLLAQKDNCEINLYVLKSLSFWEKYSWTFVTNVELFVNHISDLIMRKIFNVKINISIASLHQERHSFKIYSDLSMFSLSLAAMMYGHHSQMTWFRYGWLLLSRYLTFNNLILEC